MSLAVVTVRLHSGASTTVWPIALKVKCKLSVHHQSFNYVLHFRAALETRTQRIPDPVGHTYEVSHCARACLTIFDYL
ncbi:hypothetical protein EDB83DRAFT_2406336 [Lactarius deliciosus]|nr:hypothetical protein EDB83DRAFT_2406336 [Lactarius deliciosus]